MTARIWKEGSEMITFNKAGMKEVLKGTELEVSDWHSPYFYLGERFPVSLWHNEYGLTFHGKDWGIIRLGNKLKVKKGVRLR